ncbi:hypothetical protein QFZ77_007603 [Paenibacillus sp. V4I3]|uniref:heparinase II/III domain-containing protein n=1 Tax=unclassified Paenibacillus TaxID=185978 RepID=UPI002782F0C1|nr:MULTISPECIES: heparinase II/III family protein [unclassified Paenibacillus]MDQ0878944.1 hypothetical protein [Paenibacillus sp. V4I3]MDQ0885330.1 hypothetical protein [Paenibacillus sp. V4I9]
MNAISAEKEKLQSLVNRAEALIEARGCYFTDGAKLALADMVQAAKNTLAGDSRLPFVRNRQFVVPREEEGVLFATKRFTMVPPFDREQTVYTYYGLEPALEWFEQQDVMAGGLGRLKERALSAVGKAKDVLEQARTGTEVGCYAPNAAVRLKLSLKEAETALERLDDDETLALATVECFNRLREFRHSRVLRTDLEPSTSLYLTEAALEQVKATVAADPLVKEQYGKIARIAEHYSLDYLEQAVSLIPGGQADYNALNDRFYLWSSTDKIVNFKAPEGAVKAAISFILPAEENEEDGLGHVWIDNLEILSASGGSLKILNPGFDEGEKTPLFWEPQALRGNPVLKWEDVYPYCGGGDRQALETANPSSQIMVKDKEGGAKHSLYISNPTGTDEGAWTYTKEFRVDSGVGYTLTFEAKLDGKLKKGLKTLITYKDESGNTVGQNEYWFNRKSSIPGGRFQLAMQCDAIQYAFTKEIDYARKVKLAILYILNDFCQGAEHWLVTNLRPEGNDSYGAVQGGRLLSAIAVSYSFIREAGVFSPEEKARFYAMVEYMLRYMLDLRDRTEWTPYEAQKGCSNWQTDMCAGTGLMMMALPDFPNRHTWLNNADMILKAQLELNVNPDSSWPESIRYHHAALERFAGYAKAVDNVMGENWFETTPLARMFGYSIEMQTPGYAFFEGRVGTPPFGDHALGGGGEFGYFATYLTDIAKMDRDLADRMYYTWAASGKPFKRLWGESIILENIMGQGDSYLPFKPLALRSTGDYPDAGIYIFRKNPGQRDQSYFAIMSSPKPVAHGHLDQGSFILYKNSIPLVMDSGIEGYFDSSTSWHISSYSHACVQFATRQTGIAKDTGGPINLSAGTYSLERGWVDVPRNSKVLDIKLGDDVESITIEIGNPEGNGRHIRHVTYIKDPDLYIIRDTLEDFEGQVLFSLPVASVNSRVEAGRVHSEGAYSMDLETVFVTSLNSLRLEKGRSTQFFDSGHDGISMMEYIRAVADAKEGFLTVLYPKEKGKQEMRVSRIDGALLILETEDGVIQADVNVDDGTVKVIQISSKGLLKRT